MNLFALVASFGGGIIGAYMGALPAFILTGVIAIAGAVAAMAGGADMTVGFIAFGSYLGPHIAFAGGVAASAYAGKTKKLGSGTDILSCLNGLADPATLLVGGVFGVIGFLIHLCDRGSSSPKHRSSWIHRYHIRRHCASGIWLQWPDRKSRSR